MKDCKHFLLTLKDFRCMNKDSQILSIGKNACIYIYMYIEYIYIYIYIYIEREREREREKQRQAPEGLNTKKIL